MDVLGQHLEAHESSSWPSARDHEKAREAWMLTGKEPAERLLAFDRWVKFELNARLEWDWAGDQKTKRIEQCRIRLESMVLELWKRGWMLDGGRLARRIQELLDAVGKYQRSGKVVDFWSYFEASVRRYVGANAEGIHRESIAAGSRMNQLVAAILTKKSPRDPSLPELVAQRADEITKAKDETLRKKVARARARATVDSQQGTLL